MRSWYSVWERREREARVLEEVFCLPGRFWKKYCSWGGRFSRGVGDRFLWAALARFVEGFDGVDVWAISVSNSPSSSLGPFSSFTSSSSHICLAKMSSSGSLSSLKSPVIVRSMRAFALFRRADRSALRTGEGVSLFVPLVMGFEGVENRILSDFLGMGISFPVRGLSVAPFEAVDLLIFVECRVRGVLDGVCPGVSSSSSVATDFLLCFAFGVDLCASSTSGSVVPRLRFPVIAFYCLAAVKKHRTFRPGVGPVAGIPKGRPFSRVCNPSTILF